MIIINFSHPLSQAQLKTIEQLTRFPIDNVYDVPVQFDPDQSFTTEIEALMADFPVDSKTLQTEPILICLPSLNFIAAMLIAWLHGKTGYFPAIIRLKRQSDVLPPIFEVAEVINLQALRDQAREQR
jgi:hypothetical protein